MRFKINYGGKPTYDPKDFSRGKFECKAVLRARLSVADELESRLNTVAGTQTVKEIICKKE